MMDKTTKITMAMSMKKCMKKITLEKTSTKNWMSMKTCTKKITRNKATKITMKTCSRKITKTTMNMKKIMMDTKDMPILLLSFQREFIIITP